MVVTMYYKKHNDIPALPDDIKKECISAVEDYLLNHSGVWYRRYETENKNSVAYIDDKIELAETDDHVSGGVGFYPVPHNINEKICSFYKSTDCQIADNNFYQLQVVSGGSFVAPHIDDSNVRSQGFIYLLKSGGPDVRTIWYEVKDEYKHLELTEYSGIPYARINQIEDHCLEENCWHWLNFNKIHSVENQESLRIALWGYKI